MATVNGNILASPILGRGAAASSKAVHEKSDAKRPFSKLLGLMSWVEIRGGRPGQ